MNRETHQYFLFVLQATKKRTQTASRFKAFNLIGILQMITKGQLFTLAFDVKVKVFLSICTDVWQRGLLIAAQLYHRTTYLRPSVYTSKPHLNDFQAVPK